jgi:voltage-gated potassium channel
MIFLFFRRFADPPPMIRAAILLFAMLAYGTAGYVYFELPAKPELGFGDGFWWTVVTLTTVGYGDHFPTTLGGRFVVALPVMLGGIGLLGYVLSVAASSLVDRKNKELRGMSSVSLQGHLVVVNFPSAAKVGRIIQELRHEDALGDQLPIVVIDENLEQLPAELQDAHIHFVRGNPARDTTLTRAAIDTAHQAVILCPNPGDPHSDHQVLAVTLAIEARSPEVNTVAECIDPETEELLRKAGCDHVVCTSRFDAAFLASEARAPGSQDVVDELLTNRGQQLFFTQLVPGTKSFGVAVDACKARHHIAIGLRRGRVNRLNLRDDFEVEPGDRVISIGESPLRF